MSARQLDEYMERLAQIKGVQGACVVELATGRVVAGLSLGEEREEALLARLVAGGEVLRAQQEASSALGLGESVEDMVISHAHEYHVLRMLGTLPGMCCALALAREGAALGMARMQIVEAEGVFSSDG